MTSRRPSARQRESLWRRIATAPKDGTRVLLFAPELDHPTTVGEYHAGTKERESDGRFVASAGWAHWIGMDADYLTSYCRPTHWMPLPSPPGVE